jgi:hypothetical protein
MEGSSFRCEHSLWILTESIPFFECTQIYGARHVWKHRRTFVQSTFSFAAKGKGNVTSNVSGLMLIFFKKKTRGFNQNLLISVFILIIMLKINSMINENIIFNKF